MHLGGRWRHGMRPVAVVVAAALLAYPAPQATAHGGCDPDPSWPTERTDFMAEVVRLTNDHRVSIGRTALSVSGSLTRAAVWKARHMAEFGYADHDDPAPPVARTWFDRFADCGFLSGTVGENLAAGQPTPQAAFDAWLASPGHRSDIESPSFEAIGTGAAVASDGTPYWVQTFGAPADAGPTPSPSPTATTGPSPTPTVAPTQTGAPTPSPTPTPTPTPSPSSITHGRTITLSLGRHLVARGLVIVPDGFEACSREVPVAIQRKTDSGWATIRRVNTAASGAYRASLPDVEGIYRARAPVQRAESGDSCAKATSIKVPHRH